MNAAIDLASPRACAIATRAHPLLRAWLDPMTPLPGLDELEARRRRAQHDDGIGRPAFRAQTRGLLDDGLHYETRIAARSVLATRAHDVHDAFNALVWLRHPQLKWALNARQAADVARIGAKQRTRGQCALTHFDEAGAIVWLAAPRRLAAWDAHDWAALFVDAHEAWGDEIAVTVFGHALLEHVWDGHALPVAKCLVVEVERDALRARGRGGDRRALAMRGSRAGRGDRRGPRARRSTGIAAAAARGHPRLACRRDGRIRRAGAVFPTSARGAALSAAVARHLSPGTSRVLCGIFPRALRQGSLRCRRARPARDVVGRRSALKPSGVVARAAFACAGRHVRQQVQRRR